MAWPEIRDSQQHASRTRKDQKHRSDHAQRHQISQLSLSKMADGVRASSKRTRGLYVQMHNASSSDLVWGGKNNKRRTKKSNFFPVERVVSKRTAGGTVSVSGLNFFGCHLFLP